MALNAARVDCLRTLRLKTFDCSRSDSENIRLGDDQCSSGRQRELSLHLEYVPVTLNAFKANCLQTLCPKTIDCSGGDRETIQWPGDDPMGCQLGSSQLEYVPGALNAVRADYLKTLKIDIFGELTAVAVRS